MAKPSTSPSSKVDLKIASHNIRMMRIIEGLTQEELAQQAGVSALTLHNAELGKSVRLTTIRKISDALYHDFDEMCTKRVPVLTDDNTSVFHSASSLVWHKSEDRRRNLPEDDFALIQDETERLRLGILGFVPMFYATPSFWIGDGPGLTFVELYADYTGFNSLLYKQCVLYCLRGECVVSVGSDESQLGPGDAVAYNNEDLMTMRPVNAVSVQNPAPYLLWIGANRKGRAPTRTKRVRKKAP